MTEDGKSSSEFLDILYSFANEEDEKTHVSNIKRPSCARCCRPVAVCLCPYFPEKPVAIDTNVYILQHPLESLLKAADLNGHLRTRNMRNAARYSGIRYLNAMKHRIEICLLKGKREEESRNLATVPILCECLPKNKVEIIKGKKFSPRRFPGLAELLRRPDTLLLYPGAEAVDIEAIPPAEEGHPYNLILLDGTWGQAKSMFLHNEVFAWPKKVKLNHSCKSKFVIRTQPNDMSLSTLESTAVALASLERRPEIVEILTRPLEALCDFQIQHGACKHDSKEYKIENGLWHKTLKKKYLKKLEKDGQTELKLDSSNLKEDASS